MTGDLYFTIGAYIAAAFSVWMIPVVYFLILKANNFIYDKKTRWQDGSDPDSRTRNKFWVFNGEIALHAAIGAGALLGAFLMWPIVVFAGAIVGGLIFMRMASRLKRRMKDKEAHS